MPPRYAYWTILIDGQPTAFRSAAQEDLMPTFKRLKEKQASAEMKWFQNGKLWESRVEAQEHMRMRGERGRSADAKQGGFRDRQRNARSGGAQRAPGSRRAPAGEDAGSPSERKPGEPLEWKPKGEFIPAPKRADRPDWKPKGSFDRDRKPEWKPKGSFDRDRKPDWKPKASFDRDRKPAWKPKGAADRERPPRRESSRPSGKLEWTPKSGYTGARPAGAAPEKRKWIPKEEYKKSKGITAPRDKNWRPGGEHKDPRQKYKDAKKAKWTKFKANVRQRWEKKNKKDES
jgi:hypothetical protein